MFNAYHEASDRVRETEARYRAAKQEAAIAAQENEKACRDLSECIADLLETMNSGGDVVALLNRISEALTPAEPILHLVA